MFRGIWFFRGMEGCAIVYLGCGFLKVMRQPLYQ